MTDMILPASIHRAAEDYAKRFYDATHAKPGFINADVIEQAPDRIALVLRSMGGLRADTAILITIVNDGTVTPDSVKQLFGGTLAAAQAVARLHVAKLHSDARYEAARAAAPAPLMQLQQMFLTRAINARYQAANALLIAFRGVVDALYEIGQPSDPIHLKRPGELIRDYEYRAARAESAQSALSAMLTSIQENRP